MNQSRHQNYKTEHTEIKQFKITWKNRVLKIKNSPVELEKEFKPSNGSIDDKDKFEEKELTKKRTFAKKHLVRLV